MELALIDHVDPLLGGYDVILCDVWGVVHNGVAAWPDAVGALGRCRAAGATVVLITNAPRPNPAVRAQLARLGVSGDAFDDVVTSGDVTRALIAEGPRKVFHIGPDMDLSIFEGLDVERVEDFEASAVVCTGLFDDETETPGDYADLLARLRSRDLPMICANPDIVVERGHRLIYCAGALAREYSLLGGRTLIAGKPHRPIYEEALRLAEKARGAPVDRARVLAIGDGATTDVKGAIDNGIDLLFITDGIHAREYGEPGRPDPVRLAAWLEAASARPAGVMVKLA